MTGTGTYAGQRGGGCRPRRRLSRASGAHARDPHLAALLGALPRRRRGPLILTGRSLRRLARSDLNRAGENGERALEVVLDELDGGCSGERMHHGMVDRQDGVLEVLVVL